MEVKQLVGSLIDTIIKVILIVIAIKYLYGFVLQAYDYGYRVFAEEPVSVAGGHEITIEIKEDQDAYDIGQLLEEKGLIRDAKLFWIQERLSEYHDCEVPGIYDLSTAMTAEEMLAVISQDDVNDEEEEE